MLGIQDLPLFIFSGLLLNITPGPDSLLIMSRSANQGWRAGSAAALGIGTGTFVHVLAAALGLSALLASSATAFMVIKLAGALYLLYIGLTLLRTHAKDPLVNAANSGIAPLTWREIYVQGFLTNLLNPKVALFFLAFVPQFIAPDAPNKALAFMVLGCIFNFNGMLWCHALALFTAFTSQRLRVSAKFGLWLNRAIGALLMGLGLKMALSK